VRQDPWGNGEPWRAVVQNEGEDTEGGKEEDKKRGKKAKKR
jgi:hypothetical protein